MDIVISILIFGIIVLVHEFGHFFFARINGIVVEEFAIGMGPKIVGKEFKGTLFSIRALPFGGFCKLLGEDEVVEDENAYSSKSVWAKIQVVIGGPLFNIILAFLFALVFVALSGAVRTTEVGEVSEGFPAQEAGILPGDKIVEINGKRIVAYNEIQIYVNERKGEEIDLVYERDHVKHSIKILPKPYEDSGIYLVGISPKIVEMDNVFQIIKYACVEIVLWVKMVYYGLYMLITGAVSAGEMSGPVGIVNVVSEGYRESVKLGFSNVLRTLSFFIVLLSANLGVMNLLPIPALDGGRFVFLIIEAIRRKPMSQEREGTIHLIGYALLMVLMVVVLFNDIRKLFI